jgi:hypothetical protein
LGGKKNHTHAFRTTASFASCAVMPSFIPSG